MSTKNEQICKLIENSKELKTKLEISNDRAVELLEEYSDFVIINNKERETASDLFDKCYGDLLTLQKEHQELKIIHTKLFRDCEIWEKTACNMSDETKHISRELLALKKLRLVKIAIWFNKNNTREKRNARYQNEE